MTSADADDGVERRMRADAAKNRERILKTATRCFAERGLSVSLNDIAHEAGVGVGTVYRKFPDKDALIGELFVQKYEGLRSIAARAGRIEDPGLAFRTYLEEVFAFRASDRALFTTLLIAGSARPVVADYRAQLDNEVGVLVERARQAGCLRPGFRSRDVPMLSVMVGAIADATSARNPDAWKRYADLLIEGVFLPTASPMEGTPLSAADIAQAVPDSSCPSKPARAGD